MKRFLILWYCPCCRDPECGDDPMTQGSTIVEAASATVARRQFTHDKQCRHMQIVEIIETTDT